MPPSRRPSRRPHRHLQASELAAQRRPLRMTWIAVLARDCCRNMHPPFLPKFDRRCRNRNRLPLLLLLVANSCPALMQECRS